MTEANEAAGKALTANAERIIWDFRDLYYMTQVNGRKTWDLRWMGIPMLKCPMDLWVYQEIIHDLAPEVVIECGVYHGGSAAYMFMLGSMLGGIQVIGVDITLENLAPTVAKMALNSRGKLSFIESSSTEPELVERLKRETEGKRVMVVLDSAHDYAHVAAEMELYAPLVSLGNYMIVEDTNIDALAAKYGMIVDGIDYANNGPARAVERFLEANPSTWAADRSAERHLVTFNLNGYLKRIA